MNGVVIDTNVFVAAGFNSRRCRSTRTPSTMRCGSARKGTDLPRSGDRFPQSPAARDTPLILVQRTSTLAS